MGEFIEISAILEETVDHVPSGLHHSHYFACPGCEMLHPVRLKGPAGAPTWTWNGDVDRPTYSPSLLVRYNWGEDQHPVVCHSFVRDGQIQFLPDCSHALAGKTVPIPRLADVDY